MPGSCSPGAAATTPSRPPAPPPRTACPAARSASRLAPRVRRQAAQRTCDHSRGDCVCIRVERM
eukprot:355645-Chlamydomonas_euryale.AAC.8